MSIDKNAGVIQQIETLRQNTQLFHYNDGWRFQVVSTKRLSTAYETRAGAIGAYESGNIQWLSGLLLVLEQLRLAELMIEIEWIQDKGLRVGHDQFMDAQSRRQGLRQAINIASAELTRELSDMDGDNMLSERANDDAHSTQQ